MPSFRKRHSFHSPFCTWTQLEPTWQSIWEERAPASLMSSDQGPYQVEWQREETKHRDVQCTQTTLTETTGTALISQSIWQGYVEQEDACFRKSAEQKPCQSTVSTKLDSWWYGTMEQVRKSGIWAGLSDNQGSHTCIRDLQQCMCLWG